MPHPGRAQPHRRSAGGDPPHAGWPPEGGARRHASARAIAICWSAATARRGPIRCRRPGCTRRWCAGARRRCRDELLEASLAVFRPDLYDEVLGPPARTIARRAGRRRRRLRRPGVRAPTTSPRIWRPGRSSAAHLTRTQSAASASFARRPSIRTDAVHLGGRHSPGSVWRNAVVRAGTQIEMHELLAPRVRCGSRSADRNDGSNRQRCQSRFVRALRRLERPRFFVSDLGGTHDARSDQTRAGDVQVGAADRGAGGRPFYGRLFEIAPQVRPLFPQRPCRAEAQADGDARPRRSSTCIRSRRSCRRCRTSGAATSAMASTAGAL